MPDEPRQTQPTQPKGKGKPVEIPIPTREEVERDLRKLIAPERGSGDGRRRPAK